MKTILIFLSLICIYGCANMKKTSTEQDVNFNAIVGNIEVDCGKSRLMTLYSEGKALIQPVYEINLPDSLRIEGLKLLVEWRKPDSEEIMKYHTLGPGYCQVYIVNAKRAE